ncbi:AsmA family protein [Methylobacterium sp. E-041]|uniref:AsmA family protein n=1 Tax=Methylobacterium sp. E-041 TaxID=2836573 RepID=UPI001FBC11C8|nr:AsmA family protein [Methylobacterium sp. E-041]MCJ2108846.1 AsmA family protein [Methylobacterium sp. E-041]
MRDLLTALAGAVILILVAALAVPPFIDWPTHRAFVDATVSRSLGLPVRSEGRIDVRLLPSPRLRLDRLHLGDEPGRPALDLRFVKAELGLSPLLAGAFRFTETRIGRAEVKLPVTEGDALVVPAGLGEALRGRDLAIEDLHVQQLLLTTVVPATGRTDQFYAEAVQIQAPALVGPWRVAGTSGVLPFTLVSGEPAADGAVALKLSGGGDAHPRFEADARIAFVPADPRGGARSTEPRPLVAEAEGSARLVVGPPAQAAGAYLPFALGGKFKARGALVRFEGVNAEIDPGGQALRLSGSGQIDLRRWRAGLTLEARRLDLDAFLLSPGGQAFVARGLPKVGAKSGGGLPVMLDLDLSVEAAVLGFEEWSNLKATGTLDRTGGLLLRRFSAVAPGAATVTASGEIDTDPSPRFTGPVALAAPASDGLGRYLRRLGLDGPPTALLDGRPVEVSAEVSAAGTAFSLRNLRLALGEAQVTGNARYTPAEGRTRGRFDAQIRARGLDVAGLPPLGNALAGLHGHDLGLTIEARDLRYGATGTGNGTLSASIQSDGAALVVDSLDVTDLAGANAKLSGRIGADGTGRVAGRLSAPVAAPLLALVDRVWIAETRLIPAFLRAGALDLAVTLERDAGDADALRLAATGQAAGGSLDLSLVSRAGAVEGARIRLATPRAGTWLGRTDIAGLQQPADLSLVAARAADGGLTLQATGTIAGATLSTATPLRLPTEGGPPRSGALRIETADLAPFLTLAGAAALAPGPWPADLSVALTRQGDDARAALAGRIAGAALDATLVRAPDGALSGTARLARLSLPHLAAALAMPAGAAGRFGPVPPPGPPVSLDLRVDQLELGRGLTASGAAMALGFEEGTLTLRDLSARLAEGRIAGSATLSRRGGLASIAGEGTVAELSIPALAGGGPLGGRLSAALRFGTSGETPGALAANLSGTGSLTLAALNLPETDPAAVGRALVRALQIEDPLRDGRLQALVAEELSKAATGTTQPASAPATIIGGVVRAGPLDLDFGAARWNGTLGYDLRTSRLDARGTLGGGAAPKGWSGGPPAIQLGFAGPLAAPERSLDVGPLTTGLAALVLQRELETIELIEADQIERQRRRARIEMDKARAAALKAAAEKVAAEKAAAEKAAADRAAVEEAARQARLKAQAAEEAARRARAETAEPPPAERPLDIRPPPAQP